jgi:cytochrome c biogenesis protein CcmG/thiol:disulfide interchange protein DsbE
VINKWASWCVPCRAELGAFQRVAARYGRRVAFLGLDSGDASRTDAAAFLRAHPLSYPSYYDPSGALGSRVTDSSFTPVTVFVPVHGAPFIHQGQYPSAGKLEGDVGRYALGS